MNKPDWDEPLTGGAAVTIIGGLMGLGLITSAIGGIIMKLKSKKEQEEFDKERERKKEEFETHWFKV